MGSLFALTNPGVRQVVGRFINLDQVGEVIPISGLAPVDPTDSPQGDPTESPQNVQVDNQSQTENTAATNPCDPATIPDTQDGDVSVRFVNQTGAEVIGSWRDSSYNPPQLEELFRLPAGEYKDFPTSYVGNEWVFESSAGILGEYTVTSDPKQCVVIDHTATAQNTGGDPQDSGQNTANDVTETSPQATATQQASVPSIQFDDDGCPILRGATSVICFTIEGATKDDLLAALKKKGEELGKLQIGEGFLVLTSPLDNGYFYEWDLGWELVNNEWVCDRDASYVAFRGANVYVAIWNPPANASPDLIAEYNARILDLLNSAQYSLDLLSSGAYDYILLDALRNASDCDQWSESILNANKEMLSKIGEEAKTIRTTPPFFDD